MILKILPLGPMGVNCYILASETTRRGIVVDPGYDPRTILNTIEELKLTIDLIVLTHAHFDHTMALPAVQRATGARFAIHPLEVPSLKRSSHSSWFPQEEPLPEPDELLNDGDKVVVDDLELTVIHTPGHTPGGICLVGPGFVIAGDTLFEMSIGRTDFPGGSFEQLKESIQKRLFVLPDDTYVLPGHGNYTRISIEKAENPFVALLGEED